MPRSLEALYLRPLKRQAEYGLPVCDLQLRSYSVRNLEFFCDFALRAAYYLNLPASGPVPLPRQTERWTVLKSNFIFKKSQENFSRITLRRLIQIKDGHPETVQVWLAFLQKHAYYGIGMKANMWEFSKLGKIFPSKGVIFNANGLTNRCCEEHGREREGGLGAARGQMAAPGAQEGAQGSRGPGRIHCHGEAEGFGREVAVCIPTAPSPFQGRGALVITSCKLLPSYS